MLLHLVWGGKRGYWRWQDAESAKKSHLIGGFVISNKMEK